MNSLSIVGALATLACALPSTLAQTQTNFSRPVELSVEGAAGALPGESADKGKVVRLVKTANGLRDGRLIAVYADAAHDQPIWDPRDGERLPRDIFARYSSDNGTTWSPPVNISRTAALSSASTDSDADGVTTPFWGDSEKPNVFATGDIVVVSWVDAYVPAPGAVFGSMDTNPLQGRVSYPDLETYPISHELPYKAVWVAISYNGGTSWAYGQTQPPIQLTFGERDAKQDSHRGAGKRWIVTWQEDPEGLQLGQGDGPGEGGSGATASKGTDVWYAWTSDIALQPFDLRLHRVPLTNHSEYDLSNPAESVAMVGDPGRIENHAATRANSHVVPDGTVLKAIVAYEETKGLNDILIGKTIQYHCFPYDQPITNGVTTQASGDAGTSLTALIPNSRRVRFVRQQPNGVDPALFIFWKEGYEDQGGPSDIRGKVSVSLDPAAVAAAPTLNFSTNTPTAGPADLLLGTQLNPIEDANAHRALLRGSFIALGWCYTWNGPLARYTDMANYNFYVRRSFDGGATWDSPKNVSGITDTRLTVREPRIVQAADSGTQNDDVFVVAWGVITNVYEGVTQSEALNVQFSRTSDRGETWEKIVDAGSFVDDAEFESQLAVNEAGNEIYFVMQQYAGESGDTVFTRGTVETLPATLGTIYCLGDGTGAPCPCGNSSARDTGEGCLNSSGRGALLLASGSASVSANDLALTVTGLPVPSTAYLGFGSGYARGSFGIPFREGLFCIGGEKLRLGVATADAGGTIQFGSPLLSNPAFAAGESANFQVVYRDPLGVCSYVNLNTSNALRLELVP